MVWATGDTPPIEKSVRDFLAEQPEALAQTVVATIVGGGAQIGAATGVIARMIERTPGGRMAVAEQVIRDLHRQGLGTKEIGRLLPAIGKYAESAFGVTGVGHLGDMFGATNATGSGVRSVA